MALVNLPPQRTPPRKKGLIAGLIKGHQWFSEALIIRPAISFREGTCHGEVTGLTSHGTVHPCAN